MPYKQIVQFNLSKMGKQQGWCLQNVRMGFGTKAHYPSARADMLAQRKAGTLHAIDSVPSNCSVPVYCDTTSPYDHVLISHKGIIYNDGLKLCPTPLLTRYYKVYGWGECCDGSRVVEWSNEKYSDDDLANQVLAGMWGNGEERKRRLFDAGYNFYNIQKLVNQKLNYSEYNIYTVQAGDCLSSIGAKLQRDWTKIARDNGIESPYIIYKGQKLRIYK